MNFLPYLEIHSKSRPPLKLLIDTGANQNYISPEIVPQKSIKIGSKHTVKNMNGSHSIEQYAFFNPFSKYHKEIPCQKFYLFKFHNFFDGLIGFETLHKLGCIIDASANVLILDNTVMPLKKKFPDTIQLNFQESMHTIQEIPMPIDSGDFFLENDLKISSNVYVPSGLYSVSQNKTNLLFVNINQEPIVETIDYENITAEINNFETINFPSKVSSAVTKISQQIEKEVRTDHLNTEERSKLFRLLRRYPMAFYADGDNLSFTNVVKHTINTSDELPVYTKSYRYPFIHKNEVQDQISKMLKQGIIRPSTSPWVSPIWIVPKKADASGKKKWRLVVDYRKLNAKTIDDKYPLPNITEILDKLGKCQYFSTLDLASGFHQIEVDPKDVPKTAFQVDHGLYEYLRMPFGLKNAPATFQRVMDHVLRGLIGKCCLIYMDDIIVFSTSLQEHLENLEKILKALEKVNLKLQLDKCEFLKKEVAFLGHLVTDQGVKPNPNKIEAIQKWPVPRNQKELKGFLGILGYYRRFVRDFAKITKPLTAQLRKGETIEHTPLFLKTFETCKKLLTQSDILQYPDFEKPFVLTTDASNFALGAVLSQGPIGKDRPVAYASRTLTKAEENYSAIEKELLAIVWAAKYFRPYLFGRKFTLYTDHQPLTYALNLKTPNSKLVKWRLQLAEYDFEIKHRPGKQNAVADALSRITTEININEETSDTSSVHSADTDDSEFIKCTEQPLNIFHNQIILKIGEHDSEEYEQIFHKMYRRTITKINFGVPTLIRIFRDYMSPGRVNCILCPENVIPSLQTVYKNYFNRCKTFKVLITQKLLIDLRTDEEQDTIIADTHESAHRGILENKEQISRRWYFPSMKKKIRRYIIMCKICNQMKYERKPYRIKLGETPIPKKPLEIVHMDIFISQPCIFLSAVDKFSRFGTLIPIKSRAIPDIRKSLVKYFALYGQPDLIVSDNEPALKSIEVRGMLDDLNVQQYFTPVNHSETNGIVERFHSTLAEIFRCNRHKYDNLSLKEMFLLACTLYNNTVHSATNLKPREAFFGIKDGEERPLDRERLFQVRDKFYDGICSKNTNTQSKQHDYHNFHREEPPALEMDQQVLVKPQGINSKRRDRFEPTEVQIDGVQTFLDESSRKIHKTKLRRIRK